MKFDNHHSFHFVSFRSFPEEEAEAEAEEEAEAEAEEEEEEGERERERESIRRHIRRSRCIADPHCATPLHTTLIRRLHRREWNIRQSLQKSR